MVVVQSKYQTLKAWYKDHNGAAGRRKICKFHKKLDNIPGHYHQHSCEHQYCHGQKFASEWV